MVSKPPPEGFDLTSAILLFYTETHQAESQGKTLAKHIDLLPPEHLCTAFARYLIAVNVAPCPHLFSQRS